MNAINIPGFTAEASLYKTNLQYHLASMQRGGVSNSITLAGACTCTDPGCSWTCPSPPPPDPCEHCQGLTGRARFVCECECGGGIIRPGSCTPFRLCCT
jgi:hypothetical protein